MYYLDRESILNITALICVFVVLNIYVKKKIEKLENTVLFILFKITLPSLLYGMHVDTTATYIEHRYVIILCIFLKIIHFFSSATTTNAFCRFSPFVTRIEHRYIVNGTQFFISDSNKSAL